MGDPKIGGTENVTGNTQSLREGGDELAVLNRNIDRLNRNFDTLNSPKAAPRFSAGEVTAIIGLILTAVLATVGAFALSDRIEKVESHIDQTVDRATKPLGDKLDRLDDRFLKLDETVSREMGFRERQNSDRPDHKP